MLDYKLPIPYSSTQHIVDGSKLTTFLECPRKFFYEYLLGWRSERPNNHLVFGQAFHDALEYILLNPLRKNVADEAYEVFLKTYRETYPPDLDELFWPKTPDQCRRALREYVGKYYPEDDQEYSVIATEIAGKISVDDDRHLYFRMDSVIQDRTSLEYGSYEHKTGTRLDRQWREKWNMSIQAGTYTHVLRCVYEEVFGVVFNGVFFKKVKTPALQLDFGRSHVVLSNDQMLVWWSNVLYWLDQLEEEHKLLSETTESHDTLTAFPLNYTSCDNYFGCPYKAYCVAWVNPLRKCHEPPIGMIQEFWDPSDRETNLEVTPSGEVTKENLNGKETKTASPSSSSGPSS